MTTSPGSRLSLASLAAASVLLLAGCSGGGSGSASADRADAGSASGALADGVAAGPARPQARTATGPEVRTRSVVSTGRVSLASRHVTRSRDAVVDLLREHDGLIAEETGSSDRHGVADHARLVLRVPSADFDAVMTGVSGLGRLVDSSRSAQDVTTRVIDVRQRIHAQRVGLHRLEVLLGRASSLGNLLKVEQEVTQRRADLDSLVGQQAYLADQTSLGTITVTIDRPPAVVHHPAHSGFGAGLGAGWHGLTAFLTGAVTVLGALLPFAVAGLLVGLPAWALLRLLRRRHPAAVATDGGTGTTGS